MKFLIRDSYIEMHPEPERWAAQRTALVKYLCSEAFEIGFERWLKDAQVKLASDIAEHEHQCAIHGKGKKSCRLGERI